MARYRAAAPLFIGTRLVQPGETFDSDGKPGKNWLPADAAPPEAASTPEVASAPAAEPTAAEAVVAIPADWRSLHWTQQEKLAIALNGDFVVPDGKTKAQVAREMLEAEEQRRAAA